MIKSNYLYIFGTIAIIIYSTSVSEAYAYIDPGSGSLVIQLIIGALVGTGITLKIYWYKLKEKLLRTNKNEK